MDKTMGVFNIVWAFGSSLGLMHSWEWGMERTMEASS